MAEISNYEIPRLSAQIKLARVGNYRQLWAGTEEKGNQKFINQTRETWRELAT